MSRAEIPAEAREISYDAFSRAPSPTAANAHNRLFGTSGAIDYRVVLGQGAGGLTSTVVNAKTGDEAAEKALERHQGWRVASVAPAGDAYRSTDDFAGQPA